MTARATPEAARTGAAAVIARLMAWAPCEPPSTSTCSGRGVGGPGGASDAVGSKNSGRTGFPATKPLPRNCGRVASWDTAAALTTGASSRLVMPGFTFCSSTIVGIRRSAASRTTAPAEYPPSPMTRSGPIRPSTRQASQALTGSRENPRTRADQDVPFNPALRISTCSNP